MNYSNIRDRDNVDQHPKIVVLKFSIWEIILFSIIHAQKLEHDHCNNFYLHEIVMVQSVMKDQKL